MAALDFHCPAKDLAATGCKDPSSCLYPFPGLPHKYIHCDHQGVAHEKDCPSDQIWDNVGKACTHPRKGRRS
ncbi:hypothetical protein WJX84_004565 [Apatococcus fuscideae]|uniref:Chitin-binding type-2 domain-containing protein n=1 Tax=Apatococcus fuscideae TaxID=2026836 RepID=A0AAW1TE39_9CHLO